MTPERPRTGSLSAVLHALFYVFVFFSCQYVVTAGYMMSLMTGSSGTAFSLDEAALLSLMEQVLSQTVMITLISNLLTILVICLIQTLRTRSPLEELRIRPVNLMRIPTFLLFGASLNVFVSGTLSFLPLPEEIVAAFENQYSALYGDTPLWLEILSIAVITGITEEIIFRGLALSRLKRGMSRTAAVVVSAVIFGMFHGAFVAVVYATVLGIVFGFLADRHNSILPTVVCHIFFNATSFFLVTEDAFLLLSLYFLSIVVLFVGSYILFKKDRIEE